MEDAPQSIEKANPRGNFADFDWLDWNGSPEIRTQDQPVKSRMLYH